MMGGYSKEALETFLKHQEQLFDEPVAENPEEAAEFLEECMAEQLPTLKAVKRWLDEMGMDVSGLSDEEIEEQAEVFSLPDGSYLVVEG